jgi:hypothetical protein
LTNVSNGSGTSSTLLLSHKGLARNNYFNTGTITEQDANGFPFISDSLWSDVTILTFEGYTDHSRDPTNCPILGPDPAQNDPNNFAANGGWGYESCFGSAHPAVMPSLWADGSVRNYPYAYADPGATSYPNGNNTPWSG